MLGGFWKPGPVLGIFAFEVAYVMSKMLYVWDSVDDTQVDRLMKFFSDSVGFKELVTDDDGLDTDYIRSFIPGELFDNMIPIIKVVARLGKNHCSDPRLKDFEYAVGNWIDTGVDPFRWELPPEEMDKECKRMLSIITITFKLYGRMKLLSELERTRNGMEGPIWLETQHKIELKQVEVEKLKERSLWNMTFDYISVFLARSVFTIFSRIKSVYGVPQLMAKDADHTSTPSSSIFSKYKLLDAPPDSLGAAALALKYANVVILIEHLLGSPVSLYSKRRDELYNMLPANMRAVLRDMLTSVQRSNYSSVKRRAALMNVTMAKTLEWLAPLAHNTIKWHSMWKRQQKACAWSQVRLVETLYFANQGLTEFAIQDLIVGLQYRRQAAKVPVSCGRKGKASVVLEEFKPVTI